MINENEKILLKFAAGYPGTTLTEANILAFSERFQYVDPFIFRDALERAADTSGAYFPCLPLVIKAAKEILNATAKAERQRVELPAQTDRSQEPKVKLFEMYQRAREAARR